MDAVSKESLITRADEAFVSLAQQIHHMLDLIDFYDQRYLSNPNSSGRCGVFMRGQLMEMVNTLGALPHQLADVIRRWRHDEPRILSRLGVEVTLINEIWIALDVTLRFFINQNLDVHPFNYHKAKQASICLTSVNNCMP